MLDVDAKLSPKHLNLPFNLKLIRSELFRDASERKKNIGNLAPCLILPFLAFNLPKRKTLFWVEFFCFFLLQNLIAIMNLYHPHVDPCHLHYWLHSFSLLQTFFVTPPIFCTKQMSPRHLAKTARKVSIKDISKHIWGTTISGGCLDNISSELNEETTNIP